MTKYLSAEEREKIVANRKQLAQELIGCLVIENERKRDKRLSRLVHRYGQTVVDVVQQGRTVYYVFENGHQVPLLCACCGKALAVPDLVKERKRMRGRRLEAMSMTRKVLNDGYAYNELVLGFSNQGFSRWVLLSLSRLKLPPGCVIRPVAPTESGYHPQKRKNAPGKKVVANVKNQNAG